MKTCPSGRPSAFASLLAVLGFSFFAVMHGAVAQYSTDFNNFIAGGTVSDQGGWVTNDPSDGTSMYNDRFIGQSEIVQPINGYSTGSNDYLALFGGALNVPGGAVPGRNPVTLTHSTGMLGSSIATFGVDYVVTAPGTFNSTHDSFGFIFQGAGVNLFSVNFVPTSGNSNTFDNISVTSNGVTAPPVASFQLGLRYRLTVSINLANTTFSAGIQTESNTGTITGGYVPIATGVSYTGTLTDVGATWILASNTTAAATTGTGTAYINGGDNSLYFDNLSIVPEPSTYAMMALGLGILTVTARRRFRAA